MVDIYLSRVDVKRKDISTIDVLSACHQFHTTNETRAPWKILVDTLGAPEKVVYAAMEREADKGLIDYGTSLRTAWVTDEGYKLIDKTD